MRFLSFWAAAGLLFGQDAANPQESSKQESPKVIQARADLERMKELIAAGALAASKLADAQWNVDDAIDEAVLDRTLYGHLAIEDSTEQQGKEMVAAAQSRVDRQQKRITRFEEMAAAGVIAPNERQDLDAEMGRRRNALNIAQMRARLIDEIVAVAHAEAAAASIEASAAKPSMKLEERFDGRHGLLDSKDIKALTLAFEKRFDEALPVSALGMTAVHRALGFDHTGRIDIAVTPDSPEGLWLRKYCEDRSIPYYIFRAALPGKATNPHIHIGPGSTRLPAASSAGSAAGSD